jgi:hypothetical protein
MTSRPSTAAPILAVLAVGLTLSGGYFLAYCLIGPDKRVAKSSNGQPMSVREFSSAWMPTFFTPAGWLEAKTRRREVILNCEHHSGKLPWFTP